ncbi:hypothetical protein OFN56_38175, partial [Escherichia coli]|nr:hypothetical protein [Escherichia coli]
YRLVVAVEFIQFDYVGNGRSDFLFVATDSIVEIATNSFVFAFIVNALCRQRVFLASIGGMCFLCSRGRGLPST